MARDQDYITEARRANRQVWDGINTLVALQREHTAKNYSTTLGVGAGSNEGVTGADVTAVVFTTANALTAAIAGGHSTNMAKLL